MFFRGCFYFDLKIVAIVVAIRTCPADQLGAFADIVECAAAFARFRRDDLAIQEAVGLVRIRQNRHLSVAGPNRTFHFFCGPVAKSHYTPCSTPYTRASLRLRI